MKEAINLLKAMADRYTRYQHADAEVGDSFMVATRRIQIKTINEAIEKLEEAFADSVETEEIKTGLTI
jgi:hypothetical protein